MDIKLENGMTFVNNEEVIGKWEFFDCITSMDEFNLDTQKSRKEYNFKEIYFIPNGQKYWIFEGWTKGYLLVHHGGDEPLLLFTYEIKNINNNKYLFINVDDNNGKRIEVLKQVSNKKYELIEIGNRENTDIEFIYDENIIGTWYPVAFVLKQEDFNPDKKYDNIWLKHVTFNSNGTVLRAYYDTDLNDYWTKGYLIDKQKSVLSRYEIKNIKGVEYLFLQWKMGHYVYGGEEPSLYVFKR